MFGKWSGRMLIAIGTTQSTSNDAAAPLLLKSGSWSLGLYLTSSKADIETVLTPGVAQVSEWLMSAATWPPIPAALTACTVLALVMARPGDVVHSLVSTASIGDDGPALVTSTEVTKSVGSPTGTSRGTFGAVAIERSASPTTDVVA